MAEPADPVADALRAVASRLDEGAPPVTVRDALERQGPRSHRTLQRGALLAAAACFAVLAGALAWTSLRDEPTPPVTPSPDRTTTSTSPTSSTTATSSAPPDGKLLLDFESLPAMGILVRPANDPDALVELYGLDGMVLGTATGLSGTLNDPRLVVWPDRITPEPPSAVELPIGCGSAASGGGIRIALCGGEAELPTRVERFDADGRATLLLDSLPRPADVGEVLGHWRRATPSPDGRWVLAQWSGECESPLALLVDPSTPGVIRTLEGGSGTDWADSVESQGLGWAPDGRAIVELGAGICGTGVEVPGVYLVDPDTSARELVLATGDEPAQVYLWAKRTDASELEHLAHTALADLQLEITGGEPSHGAGGVTTGARYEGYDIGVNGAPSAAAGALLDIESAQRLPLLHGEATALRLGSGGFGRDVVAFRCGANTWWLSWRAQGATAEVDSMLLLAEALVPHLGCTLGEPPG